MKFKDTGFWAIFRQCFTGYATMPVYWVGVFILPLFLFLFLGSLMREGLPEKAPAAILDLDHTSLSRNITQNLASMQMVDMVAAAESYTQARHLMQEGKIYGYFLIPEGFTADLLAGRSPQITFYTNQTYYLPATMLYKTFKTTAVYTKMGILMEVARDAGLDTGGLAGTANPVSPVMRPIGNPWLNYAYYLCNGFIPGALQLMILLITTFTLGEVVKYGRSGRLMRMADGNIVKALAAQLLPQTIAWVCIVLLMESWMFRYNGYPMNGSWGWLTLSEIMFVLASQALGVFIFCLLPNLRLSVSISALLGIVTFSIAAYSFPVPSMYPGIAIFSYIVPARYNFLIYVDQALNGIDIYYSRLWFVAYLIFMALPLPLLWRIRKAYLKPVYLP